MPTTSPFDFAYQDRERSRQRTRTFLLYQAVRELFPENRLHLAYSLGGAFYYYIKGKPSVLPGEVGQIKDVMARLGGENMPLKPLTAERDAVIQELEQVGRLHTANWLKDSPEDHPILYRAFDEILAFKGPLTNTTGGAGVWDLIPYPPGLLLRVAPPDRDTLPEYEENPTLFRSFFEAEHWGGIHGASYLSEVNRIYRTGQMDLFVQVVEAMHEQKIAGIAERIAELRPRPRVILISGPSSAGKTSFSKRLQVGLRLQDMKPLTLSLDNFYLPRDRVPRRNGDYDFEALDSLDIAAINDTLMRLAAGEVVRPPVLDFATHQNVEGEPIQLGLNGVLIVEGIHGLNPALTPYLTEPSIFRVYVSALTSLSYDELSRMSTTDLRLLRRIVRDRRSRGYPAGDTLSRWASVREGEFQNIFPFQEQADIMFNSALPYELNALKEPVLEALDEVDREDLTPEIKRLRRLLDAVDPVPRDWLNIHVPPTSILREFIGGSVLAP